MIVIFIYNILLIILYSITLTFAINFYLKEKKQLFLAIVFYILFFILDNVVIYMTEFIHSFAQSYDQTFMSTPAIKTIIFMGNSFFSTWALACLRKEKIPPFYYGLLIGLAIWMVSIPLMTDSALKVWLYYLGNQIYLFILGVYCWRGSKKDNLPALNKKYLKNFSIINLFFSIAIILEDSFVIFNVDQYTSSIVRINNRSISEDIFSIIVCLLLLHYFLLAYRPYEKSATTSNEQAAIIQQFCYEQNFTKRETEIFQLLLVHASNQEIADQLFLSLGTVKTHVHNIFIKLNIEKRNQIFPIYHAFYETKSSSENS